jgi:hypothetical protein
MTQQKSPPSGPRQAENNEQGTAGLIARPAPAGNHNGSDPTPDDSKPDAAKVGDWDAYRRWLSRVNLPDKRRTSMDPSLYTWKGYRSWADKVRRDWSSEK